MYYRIKNIKQELKECESEYFQRVIKFFEEYIEQSNYTLIDIQWIVKEDIIPLYNCIITYTVKN